MRPQGLCLPIISMAARLQMDGDMITAAGISMGPVGPCPGSRNRLPRSSSASPPPQEQFEKAANVALENISLRTSKYRATAEYRETMIRTYLPIILATAARRAGATP